MASLPLMDVLPNTIYASEAFLAMSICTKDLPKNYVPFVDVTEAFLHPAKFAQDGSTLVTIGGSWRQRNVDGHDILEPAIS